VTHEISLNFLLEETHDILIFYQLQTNEGTGSVPSDRYVGIPFAVGKEAIRSQLSQEHLCKWKACKGCQSKTLIILCQ